MLDPIIIWLAAAAYSLTMGAYGWAWLLYTRLTERLDNFANNHLKHIEDRLDKLEAKRGRCFRATTEEHCPFTPAAEDETCNTK